MTLNDSLAEDVGGSTFAAGMSKHPRQRDDWPTRSVHGAAVGVVDIVSARIRPSVSRTGESIGGRGGGGRVGLCLSSEAFKAQHKRLETDTTDKLDRPT